MKINPTVQKYASKAWPVLRRVRPGHIMFGVMLVMTCVSRCSSQNSAMHNNSSANMRWAYEQGQQSLRDSLKIVELRDSLKMAESYNKTVADSMKYFHALTKCK